ncbi:MAG: hypothetical protein WC608_03945 [Parcubacteria group bacterium]
MIIQMFTDAVTVILVGFCWVCLPRTFSVLVGASYMMATKQLTKTLEAENFLIMVFILVGFVLDAWQISKNFKK